MKKIKYFLLFACIITGASIFGQKSYNGLTFLHQLQDNRTDGKNSFYEGISNSASIMSFATPITYWTTGMITKDNTLKKYGLFTLESLAISMAFTYAIKPIVNKPRPAEYDPTIVPLSKAENGSFPSGHTAEAFATATSLSIINHKWYVIVPSFAWAGLVGYSRLYMGVHYPSDVIGGAIIGSASALLSYKLNKWMHVKKKAVPKNEHSN